MGISHSVDLINLKAGLLIIAQSGKEKIGVVDEDKKYSNNYGEYEIICTPVKGSKMKKINILIRHSHDCNEDEIKNCALKHNYKFKSSKTILNGLNGVTEMFFEYSPRNVKFYVIATSVVFSLFVIALILKFWLNL
jgi:hypothetical protein